MESQWLAEGSRNGVAECRRPLFVLVGVVGVWAGVHVRVPGIARAAVVLCGRLRVVRFPWLFLAVWQPAKMAGPNDSPMPGMRRIDD
eukprot:12386836-Alexandrium_andersonii.AAC.1